MKLQIVVASSFFIFSCAVGGNLFNPLCVSDSKKDGAAISIGGAYDSDHFSYNLKNGAIHEQKNNPLCLLLSMYTSTYVSDAIDVGVEFTVKFPKKVAGKALSAAYKEYNDKLTSAGAEKNAADAKNANEPYRIEINQQMSTSVLLRCGYYLENIDAVLFAGVGVSFSKVKFSIAGKAKTNSNADVMICNKEISNTVPVFAFGISKSVSRKSSVKLQYTMQMSKTNSFDDDIHVTHHLKYKNNSIALTFVHYL